MKITCQSCDTSLKVPNAYVGKTMRCPRCKAKVKATPEPTTATSEPTADAWQDEDWESALDNFPEETRPPQPPQRANEPARTGKSDKVAISLATIALLLSAGALAWAIFHNPLGRGIESYDFTTPQKALESNLLMGIRGDIRASLDLSRIKDGRTNQELLDTYKIHRDAEYQGKKILFISYTEHGIKKYDISSFEKDAESGLWLPSFVSTYSIEDESLKADVEKWKSKIDDDSDRD